MTEGTKRHSRDTAMLRGILADYQDVISGPDVQRGMDALVGLVEQFDSHRIALEELLSVAERIRSGDSKLNPEEWYAARDYARKVLASNPASRDEA